MSVLFVVFIPVEELSQDPCSPGGDPAKNSTKQTENESETKATSQEGQGSADNEETESAEGKDGNLGKDASSDSISTGNKLRNGCVVQSENGDKDSPNSSPNHDNNSTKPFETKTRDDGEAIGTECEEKAPLLTQENLTSASNSSPESKKSTPSLCDVEEGRGQGLPVKQNSEPKFKVELVKEDNDATEEINRDLAVEDLSVGEGGKVGVSFQLSALSTEVPLETEVISVEQVLQAVLSDLNIQTDTWTKSDDTNFWQVTFVVEKEDIDMILDRLSYYGIGHMLNTSVSIFPASYYQCGRDKSSTEDAVIPTGTKSLQSDPEEKNNFISSIKARLTVAQVVEAVKTNSRFTFDFVMLIVLASLIAALGLVENSSVILVASMLVSPLMGPILGVTFGLVVQNKPLFRLGLINEAIGLAVCLLVGFLFGFVVSAVNYSGSNWGATPDWPTSEMKARGMLRSLWVGLLVALPSGAGVAFSILGGNVGSLVGVAISASLLPPAVNAGMLWAYGFVSLIKPPQFVVSDVVFNDMNVTQDPLSNLSTVMPTPASPTPPDCGSLEGNAYVFHYSCDMHSEAFLLGTVSLTLTLLNILCIFAMGVAILKIKEVAPRTAISDGTDKFWKSDIQVARETYKTLKTSSPSYSEFSNLAKRLAQEEKEKSLNVKMPEILEEITTDDDFKTIQSRLIVKPHLKVEHIFRRPSSHYSTVGPAPIWRRGHVAMETGPPSSPIPASPEPSQQTWMGLRHRRGHRPSQSADVLNPSRNPFRFPRPDHVGKGKRTPRMSMQKSSSLSVEEEDAKMTTSVSTGRFEISSVPEERRGSLMSPGGSSGQQKD